MVFKPHPKQIEFFENDSPRILYGGGLTGKGYFSEVFRRILKMPIDKPYAYHKPSTEGMEKINKLREHFSEGERLINEICPKSRQASIAITNNEQTAMWAIKAVVFNDPNSETE